MIARLRKRAEDICKDIIRNRLYGFKKSQLLREIRAYGKTVVPDGAEAVWVYNFFELFSEDKKWMLWVHEKLWRGYIEDDVREVT